MRITFLLFPILFFTVFDSPLFGQGAPIFSVLETAQKENQNVRIILNNGNEYVGKVTQLNEDGFSITTADGSVSLIFGKVKAVKIVDPNIPSSAWFENPIRNRLFISQSGRMLEKNTGYYQNTYILFSSLNYAVSNMVTLSGGFSTIPGIGPDNQLYNMGVKVGKNISESLSIASTATYTSFLSETDAGFSTFSAAATFTSNALDVTIGTGFATTFNESSEPIFLAGAQWRVAQRFSVLTENLFLPSEDGFATNVISFGGRFIGRNVTADLGFWGAGEFEAFVPFVSFAVRL